MKFAARSDHRDPNDPRRRDKRKISSSILATTIGKFPDLRISLLRQDLCFRVYIYSPSFCTDTERMRTIGRRLGSRHILWLLCGFLRPHVTGDSTCKIIDLVKVSLDRFRYGVEEEMLEAFTDKWDHVLAGISVDRPDDGMLYALFYEQVRELHCLKLDMQLWDRDASVRNYEYLRNICANGITTRRRRRNQEKMYSATRSSSLRRRDAAPAHGSPHRTGSRQGRRSFSPGRHNSRRGSPFRKFSPRRGSPRRSSPRRSSPRRGSPRRGSRSPGRAAPAPTRRSPSRSPRRCTRGSGCKFSHNLKGRSASPKGFPPRSKSPISKESGECFYFVRGIYMYARR